MRNIRISLGLKISMAVTALIVVLMAGVSILTISYQRESLRQSISESNLAMTKNLAHDAVEPMLIFDPLRLDELVRTVSGVPSCSYAMISDREGRTVAHTERSMLGTQAGVTATFVSGPAGSAQAGKDMIREHTSGAVLVKEFSYPIKIGSEVLGIARIAFSLDRMNDVIEERLSNLRKYIYMIAGFAIMAGIAGAFVVSNLLTKPLKRLKLKMMEVQAGNLEVQVENRRVVECWKRLNCDKKNCPSYGELRCWATAGTYCRGEVQGQFAQKIGDCRKCVVYRESCGDEINELVEVFNQMVKDLRYNLSELEKANAEKAKMERLSALGEMATTVAHETKNPLNAIKMATSYLKNNFEGEILTELLTIIQEEVTRLNDISTSFLGFSKPPPLRLKTCDINSIVRSTVGLIRQEATERDIEVIMLTDEGIPTAQCDYPRMKQALLNVLLNALDASGAGDTVTVTTGLAGPDIVIAVEDSGKGMSETELRNIFKPFYTTKTRGSGLGLAIVERIVKEHGGEIEVYSTEGKGTRLMIRMKVFQYAKT